MNDDKLLSTAKWEYKAIQDDMVALGAQHERWEYEGGFEAWYKEVFLVDEAWAEIRADALTN